jgi:hypothetical protein
LVRQTLIGDPDKMTGAGGVFGGSHACAPVKVFLWVPYGGMRPWVPGQRGCWRLVPCAADHSLGEPPR